MGKHQYQTKNKHGGVISMPPCIPGGDGGARTPDLFDVSEAR